jgi:hypothetical protein
VANYDVSIKLAVAGAKQLDKVNKQTDQLRKNIDFINNKAQKGTAGTPVVRNFKNLSKAVSDARDALDEAALGTKEFNQAIKNVVKVENKFNRQQKIKERALKVEELRLKEGITLKEAKIRVTQEEIELENKLAIAKEKSATAEKRRAITRGITSGIGSGIIGGGFPLLFGQGPTAALGGALGGVAGGAMSAIPGMGQFGFALSIAGTTIGSSLEQLTKALTKPTENIETLVNRLGLVGTETGDLALELKRLGLESSAAELLLKEFEREFGLTADQIEENAEKMSDFNNEINKLGTSLTLLLSDVLGPLIKQLNDFIKGQKPEGTVRNVTGAIDFFTANAFDLDKRGGILSELPPLPGDTKGLQRTRPLSNIPTAEGNAVIGGVKLNPNFGQQSFNPNQDAIDLKNRSIAIKEIEPLKQALIIEQNRLNISDEKLQLMQENFALTNLENELKLAESQRTDEVNDKLETKIQKLKLARDTQAQVVENTKALIDPFKQLSDIIQIEMGNGIKDLIKGTQSLNDVMRNMLNKMADAFLNLAIFGNIGGGSITGGLLGSIFRAEGGPVKAGGSYIVGERGPELFTPSASGNIIPNNALGGSTNIVVNVDASGSAVEGDEDRGRELGRLISVAVQSEIIQQKRPGGLLA